MDKEHALKVHLNKNGFLICRNDEQFHLQVEDAPSFWNFWIYAICLVSHKTKCKTHLCVVIC